MAATDAQLLHSYATEKSEAAFAELVRRHLGVVYHSALRQLGDDRSAADDVAQEVFVRLARKAVQPWPHENILGWLFTTTRHVASEVRRGSGRRRAREQQAAPVSEFAPQQDQSQAGADLRVLLDGALADLRPGDREVLLQRFFAAQSFSAVGEQFGLSENSARMRVERALARLQELLKKRGVTSTAGALAASLGAEAALPAPAPLFATVTAASLGAGSAASTALTTGNIFLTMTTATKITAGIAAIALATTATLLVERQNLITHSRSEIAHLRTESASFQAFRDENQSLRARQAELVAQSDRDHAELARVQKELDAYKKGVAAYRARQRAEGAASPGSPATAAAENNLAPGMIPVGVFNNAGRSTPANAAQTLMFATHNGDTDLASSLLTFAPADRARMEAFIATLPENIREQYGTPEKMMAFVISGSPRPISGVELVDQSQPDPDTVVQHVKIQYQSGDIRSDEIQFHKAADGWQQVISPALVDRTIAAFKAKTG